MVIKTIISCDANDKNDLHWKFESNSFFFAVLPLALEAQVIRMLNVNMYMGNQDGVAMLHQLQWNVYQLHKQDESLFTELWYVHIPYSFWPSFQT